MCSRQKVVNIYLTNIQLTIPSCVGLLVILTFPLLVSTMVPFVRIFCLAKNLFEGVSKTFFISAFTIFHCLEHLLDLDLSRNTFSFSTHYFF